MNLGQCYRALAQKETQEQSAAYLEQSEEYLNQAIALGQQIGYRDLERIAEVNLGNLSAQDLDNAEQGLMHYKRAIEILEQTRGMLIEETHRIGFFGRTLDAYNGLIKVYLQKDDLRAVWTTLERSRSCTLVEQLAQTTISPPTGVAASLLDREAHWLAEIRRLNLVIRNVMEDEAASVANEIETVQQSLDKVLEKMPPQAADYVALRRGLPVEFDEIKECLLSK